MQKIREKCAAIGFLEARTAMLGLTAAACFACSAPQEPAADTVAPAIANYACGERGYLATNLHGALSLAVDWSADDLSCEGMPRPGGEGARLRFAGSEGERNIAIIIGLPGQFLQRR